MRKDTFFTFLNFPRNYALLRAGRHYVVGPRRPRKNIKSRDGLSRIISAYFASQIMFINESPQVLLFSHLAEKGKWLLMVYYTLQIQRNFSSSRKEAKMANLIVFRSNNMNPCKKVKSILVHQWFFQFWSRIHSLNFFERIVLLSVLKLFLNKMNFFLMSCKQFYYDKSFFFNLAFFKTILVALHEISFSSNQNRKA